MFFKGSRYTTVDEHEITDNRGRPIRYKKVRFIPETQARLAHVVSQGERLDHIAHRYYRDPKRFWTICDTNRTMWPDDLVAEVNRRILIP